MKTSRRILLTLSIVLIPTFLFGEEAKDTDKELQLSPMEINM